MPLQQLDSLVRIGKLKAEPPARAELEGLLRSGKARLKDCALKSLSRDSKFDLAYNAAHALSLAALRWHGYRSESRYIVFQCLEHTLGLEPKQWRVLDEVDALVRITTEIDARVSALPAVSSRFEP